MGRFCGDLVKGREMQDRDTKQRSLVPVGTPPPTKVVGVNASGQIVGKSAVVLRLLPWEDEMNIFRLNEQNKPFYTTVGQYFNVFEMLRELELRPNARYAYMAEMGSFSVLVLRYFTVEYEVELVELRHDPTSKEVKISSPSPQIWRHMSKKRWVVQEIDELAEKYYGSGTVQEDKPKRRKAVRKVQA